MAKRSFFLVTRLKDFVRLLLKTIMKNKFFLIILVLIFISCERNGGPALGYISKKDTTCLKEVAEAKAAIKKNKLTFCNYTGDILFVKLRCQNEMTRLLAKYNIEFRNEGSSCIVYEDQTEHCYCKMMEYEIKQKYGEHFMDSLLETADKMWLTNNIDSMFDYAECDERPNYPGDTDNTNEYSKVLQKELKDKITYPQAYKKRPDYDTSAFVDITFNVSRDGRAKIDSFYFLFDIDSNHKFEKYLEGQIDEHIKKTGWQPAKIRNQKVNSDMVFRFELD
jgi:hypothetical protein